MAKQQTCTYVNSWELVVQSPQPASNPNQTLTAKQVVLLSSQEEEV